MFALQKKAEFRISVNGNAGNFRRHLRPIGSVDSKLTSLGGSIPEVHLLGSLKAIGSQTIWSSHSVDGKYKDRGNCPLVSGKGGGMNAVITLLFFAICMLVGCIREKHSH